MSSVYSLHQLGWRASYAQHLGLDDFESAYPARVMAVHRNGLAVLSSRGHAQVVVPQRVADALEVSIAVGDWCWSKMTTSVLRGSSSGSR